MLGAMAGAAALLSLTSAGAAADVKTLEAGKLTIGMNGDMPMTQLKDGQLSGTDGELMVYVAKQIGLEPKPVQMDWAALIEATKQGKLDVMHGAMGWLEARTKIMIPERADLLLRHAAGAEGREQLFDLRRHEGHARSAPSPASPWCPSLRRSRASARSSSTIPRTA